MSVSMRLRAQLMRFLFTIPKISRQRSRPSQSGRDFLGFETESEQQEKIWGRQQAVHAKESAALGRTLVRRLSANGNAEPMQAPLAGLKAIDCPAALVEVGIESDRAKAVDNLAGAIEQYAGQNR